MFELRRRELSAIIRGEVMRMVGQSLRRSGADTCSPRLCWLSGCHPLEPLTGEGVGVWGVCAGGVEPLRAGAAGGAGEDGGGTHSHGQQLADDRRACRGDTGVTSRSRGGNDSSVPLEESGV